MLLIGATGKARAGKDTFGKFLFDTYGFGMYAMATPLKMMLETGLGLKRENFQTTAEKEEIIPWLGVSYRHCAQTLGTDWMRKLVADDGWIRIAKLNMGFAREKELRGLVITDIRFENEAAMIREQGGVVVHILSNRETLTGAVASHASESGVAKGPGDQLLFNWGGIPEFHASAAALVNGLLGDRRST